MARACEVACSPENQLVILLCLQERLAHPAAAELSIAAAQQHLITAIR